jgi:hypothetical protein
LLAIAVTLRIVALVGALVAARAQSPSSPKVAEQQPARHHSFLLSASLRAGRASSRRALQNDNDKRQGWMPATVGGRYKSSGRRPVCLAMRANILGPISTAS